MTEMYILNANALSLPLADNIVQACITSPPYWGLRDYGTATWKGGDPACAHQVGRFEYAVSEKQRSNNGSAGHQARGQCPHCGAVRTDAQLGLEPVPDCLGWATGHPCGECYVCHMVQVFREVRRVLRPDGTLWLNLGDSYNGSGGAGGDYQAGGLKEGQPRYPGRRVSGLKPKDLVGIPWRVALALQADGWYLRSDVIWHKPNPMPESVTDRPTKAHEYFFLLSKSEKYFYDAEAVKEPLAESTLADKRNGTGRHTQGKEYSKYFDDNAPGETAPDLPSWYMGKTFVNPEAGRNRRSVWTVPTRPYSGAHFATFPPDLVEVPVLASTSPKACPHCRAPWERMLEVVGREKVRWKEGAAVVDAQWGGVGKTSVIATGEVSVKETTGWQPTCTCPDNDGSGKCLVLDPFSGTATVGRVCIEKGRAYVGTELNRQYIELAQARTSRVQVELFQL